MLEITIISENDSVLMKDKVNKKLQEGWQLKNKMDITSSSFQGYWSTKYTQVMIRTIERRYSSKPDEG